MSKEEIADRLKRAREKAGYSQKEAAKALNVTLQSISNYERAVSRIDVESLVLLCQFYGCSIDSIVYPECEQKQEVSAAAHFDPATLTDDGRQQYEQYIEYLTDRFSKE